MRTKGSRPRVIPHFLIKKIHVLFWISHIHQKSITRQRSREQYLLYRISSEFFGTNIPGKDRLKDWGNRQRLTPAYLFCKAAIMLSFVDLSALQEYFSVQIPFVRLKIMLQSKKKKPKTKQQSFFSHTPKKLSRWIYPSRSIKLYVGVRRNTGISHWDIAWYLAVCDVSAGLMINHTWVRFNFP